VLFFQYLFFVFVVFRWFIILINMVFFVFKRTFLGSWPDGFGVFPRQIWGATGTDLGLIPDRFGLSGQIWGTIPDGFGAAAFRK
jgi:hypothetical protein